MIDSFHHSLQLLVLLMIGDEPYPVDIVEEGDDLFRKLLHVLGCNINYLLSEILRGCLESFLGILVDLNGE